MELILVWGIFLGNKSNTTFDDCRKVYALAKIMEQAHLENVHLGFFLI